MTQTYILGGISAAFVILLIVFGYLGRHQFCPTEKTGISAYLYKAGAYIAGKKWFRRFYSLKVRQTLQTMHPADDMRALQLHYYAGKLQVCMVVMVTCFSLLTLFSYVTYRDSVLQDGSRLIRGGYTDEEEPVSLLVTDEDGSSRLLKYELLARSYPDEQLEQMVSQFSEEIETLVLSDNKNTSEIYSNLNLQTTYADYPFEVDWESSDYGLVDSDGTVKNDETRQTQLVTLTAHLAYRDKEWECAFPIMVHPRKETALEQWIRQARQQLRAADEKSRTDEAFLLPGRLLGKEVSFRLSNEGREWMLAPLCIVLATLLFYMKDHDLDKELEKRRDGIERSYPEFVGKFVLLFGAGLSVRSVLQRISEGADLNEDLRLELKVLLRDLKNGISESEALTRFGKRLGSPLYIRFSSFLIGNLKKGNSDLLRLLQEEAENAFILRKNHAKKLGEEASAKLLFPMFLMLGVVMAVIIMPAFMSL